MLSQKRRTFRQLINDFVIGAVIGFAVATLAVILGVLLASYLTGFTSITFNKFVVINLVAAIVLGVGGLIHPLWRSSD